MRVKDDLHSYDWHMRQKDIFHYGRGPDKIRHANIIATRDEPNAFYSRRMTMNDRCGQP